MTQSAPTPKQTAYLAKLIEQAGMTQEEFRESHGLYEHSPWGRRLRSELITRSRVSLWISELKAQVAKDA